jgi:hypothetical protein
MADDTRGLAETGHESEGFDPRLLGGAIGGVQVLVFAVIGLVGVDDPVFGAAVGFAFGSSTYLYVTYAMELRGHVPGPAPVDDTAIDRSPVYHRGAAGLAMVPIGIIPFVWRLFAPGYTLGILVGLVLAIPTYVLFSTLLPDA